MSMRAGLAVNGNAPKETMLMTRWQVPRAARGGSKAKQSQLKATLTVYEEVFAARLPCARKVR